MKKFMLLITLPIILIISWCWDEDDVSVTDFEYDVSACDKYFEIAECILNNAENPDWDKDLKNELRQMIKQQQEQWKQLSEKELVKNCTKWLANYDNKESRELLESLGCSLD
jgi:hypothetical protein